MTKTEILPAKQERAWCQISCDFLKCICNDISCRPEFTVTNVYLLVTAMISTSFI